VKRLVLGTGNAHKVYEVRSALASYPEYEIVAQPDTVPAVDETGRTFLENAVIKAVHTSHYVDDLVLADDSGLCIDALDGRPGIYSARYVDGTDQDRVDYVLKEMQDVAEEQRTAAFVCALALARRGEVIWTGEGRVVGRITHAPVGSKGFGYDPIFWIPQFNRTMAELTIDEKNQTSHRGRALKEFVKHFTG
jgi:XTP/dITP diphosphohydrolase